MLPSVVNNMILFRQYLGEITTKWKIVFYRVKSSDCRWRKIKSHITPLHFIRKGFSILNKFQLILTMLICESHYREFVINHVLTVHTLPHQVIWLKMYVCIFRAYMCRSVCVLSLTLFFFKYNDDLPEI